MVTAWQNRIIGHAEVDPSQLLANPDNWRIHPIVQQDALLDVLDRIGWVDTVIVNQRTGNMIDGHLRVQLALRRDEPTVPVEFCDLSLEEERAVLATFDPIGAMAVPDSEKLEELLALLSKDEYLAGVLEHVEFTAGSTRSRGPVEPEEQLPEFRCPSCGHTWRGSPLGAL